MAKKELKPTPKQLALVYAYIGEARFNGRKAAEMAGYKATPGSLYQIAYETLRKPHVRAILEAELEKRIMSADETMFRLTAHAQSAIGEFMKPNPAGGFDWDWEKIRNDGLGRIKSIRVARDATTIQMTDALEALKIVAQYHKLLTQVLEHKVDRALIWDLPIPEPRKPDE